MVTLCKCSLPPEEKLADTLLRCREAGLRRTRGLQAILAFLIKQTGPVNWTHVSKAAEIAKVCDSSSVYRILIRLEQIGIARRVGSQNRSYSFVLIEQDGHHHDYLICTECGATANLDIKCPVEKLEKGIERKTGYRKLHHELDFYGICPKCQ